MPKIVGSIAGQNTSPAPFLEIPSSSLCRSSFYDRVTAGNLAGNIVHAFVDPCAENLVTESWVRHRGLANIFGASGHVQTADGTSIPTLGTIELSWQFYGEEKVDQIRLHVIPGQFSHYAVTLGGAFLWKSQTLTKHNERLRIVDRGTTRRRIFYQGSGQLRMQGLCEDQIVAIHPDLASDISAMSLQLARRIGRSIDLSLEHRIQLELPGRRTISTYGQVADVEFKLGIDVYTQSFYVIDGLPGDLLVDAEFLTRTDAFRKHQDVFSVVSGHQSECLGSFLVVRKASDAAKCKPTPSKQNKEAMRLLMCELCEADKEIDKKKDEAEAQCKNHAISQDEFDIRIKKLDKDQEALFKRYDDAINGLLNKPVPVEPPKPPKRGWRKIFRRNT